MPPSEPPKGTRSRRRRRDPAPSSRNAQAQQSAYVSQGRAVARARPTPRPAPPRATRVQAQRGLGFPARNAPGTFLRPRGQAVARKRQAQRALPARAMPHVPIIRNPTPRQAAAARTVIAQAVNRAAGGDPARRREVLREIQTDPRHAQTRRAIEHYVRAQEHQQSIAAARAFGVRGSRGTQIRAGRMLVAAQRARDGSLRPGRMPKVVTLGPASVNLTGLGRTVMAATSLNAGDLGPRNLVRNAGRDVGALATGPFVGGYELGAGVVDAARGRGTGRLQALARGVAQSTYDTFRHPARSLMEHPLLTPLTFAGGIGAVGRTGGAIARGLGSTAESAGIRGSLARAGSTVRPPIAYSQDSATAGLLERSYSKDVTRKAVQVQRDALREPLTRPDGSTVTVRRGGREVPVLKPTVAEMRRMGKRQGNFLSARQNATERMVRDQVGREMEVRGVRGRVAKDLVAMVTEGTITSSKHFETDLRAYRNMVANELGTHETRVRNGQTPIFHDSKQVEQARATIQRIDSALADKRVLAQKDRIVQVGTELGKKLNEDFESEAQRLGVLNPKRAARSRLIHPAVLHAGARHFTAKELRAQLGVKKKDLPRLQDMEPEQRALLKGGLRDAQGRFLSNQAIEDALRAKGRDPATVAYLPPGALGRRAFHARFNVSRPTIGGDETRTGEQFRRGLTTATAESVREQATRLATQVEKARSIDDLVSEHGMRHPRGRDFTGREAAEYAKRLEAETGEKLVAVRRVPSKAGKEMEQLARKGQTVSAMESLGERLLNDRLNVRPGTKNVVLMPASLVQRLQEHAAPSGALVRLGQMVNRPFRAAVLPQPRWLTGNIVEPFVVRLTTQGSGLNVFGLAADLDATAKTLKYLERSRDPKLQQAAKRIRAQQTGGLFVGARGANVHRELEEMPGNEVWGPVIARTPAVRNMLNFGRLLGRGAMKPANLFFRANRAIEAVAQRAALGRQLRRDMQEFTGSWTRALLIGDRAVEEAANGLVNTSTQRRFMEAQHELLGKYEGFNPTMRALTQTILPFLPWMLNATRFVFWTMPVHNTTKTALLTQANAVMQKDWQEIHKDTPPGSLRYAIPNGKGGWIDIARYLPTGAFTEAAGGGGYGTFTSQLLPQVSGVVAALEGRDPFGRELTTARTPDNPQGKVNELAVAANTAAESMVPYLAQARRLREGGGTGYSDSNIFSPKVKPGTQGQMSAFNRVFNPVRPVYLRAPSGGGGDAAADPSTRRALDRARRSAARTQDKAALDRALERARRAAAGG